LALVVQSLRLSQTLGDRHGAIYALELVACLAAEAERAAADVDETRGSTRRALPSGTSLRAISSPTVTSPVEATIFDEAI